jgi:hypothetical protein
MVRSECAEQQTQKGELRQPEEEVQCIAVILGLLELSQQLRNVIWKVQPELGKSTHQAGRREDEQRRLVWRL